MKITVLCGGTSTERDVSLTSGSLICKALKEKGHEVILLDVFLSPLFWVEVSPFSGVLSLKAFQYSGYDSKSSFSA